MNKFREFWLDYRSEVFFALVLSAMMVCSYWAASFIPEEVFDRYINPVQYIATVTVCFFGAWVVYRHHGGNRLRKSWATTLVIWGVIDSLLLVGRYGCGIRAVGGTPDDPLYNSSLVIGNVLAWLLYVYPTQMLRPQWLTWNKVAVFVLPMVVLGVVDYFIQTNLILIIMLYPFCIFLMLCRHVRNYRRWCEDNFSSMDNIDVQWIVRYLTVLFLLGVSFYFIVFWYVPNRMFTQQWLLFLILAYSTEQILFRKDPWSNLSVSESEHPADEIIPLSGEETQISDEHDVVLDEQAFQKERILFEQWMEREKPYTNPDFQLIDIRHVLPTNRTYLSHFLKSTYHCSFYNLVNRYRVEEAMRLMREHPDMKMTEVAYACGFSSPAVFSRTFTRLEGISPRDRATETAGKKG